MSVTDGRTNERTDERTDERTNVTNGRTSDFLDSLHKSPSGNKFYFEAFSVILRCWMVLCVRKSRLVLHNIDIIDRTSFSRHIFPTLNKEDTYTHDFG